MKFLPKVLKVAFITAVGAVLLWGGAYLISPTVKNWTNEHIFHIEQTVEDETPEDGENQTPEDGTEEGTGENDNPLDGMPDPEEDRVQEESTEE